jgi:aminopeptidase-like protein
MQENYVPPTYVDVPAKKRLRMQYDLFCERFGRVKRKVGMTCQPELRYGRFDFYHFLTEETYFAFTTTHAVARAIEVMMIDILMENDEMVEHTESSAGVEGVGKKKYFLYLTTAKTNEDECPICNQYWIEGRDDRRNHLDCHVKEKNFLEFCMRSPNASKLKSAGKANAILEWPSKGRK